MTGIECAMTGTLTKDADARTSKNGKPFTLLNLIVGDGDSRQFVSAIVFGDASNNVATLEKGRRVYLEGKVEISEWTSSDGTKKHGLKVASGTPRATVTVGRMKDGEEGDTWSFELNTMKVGVDRKGNPKWGAYVVITDQPTKQSEDHKPKSRRLPKAAQIALRALAEAIDECGEIPPASNHIPLRMRTVTVDQWRQYAYRRGISTGEERAKQQAFKRGTDQVIADQHVGHWDGQVWLTR